MGFGLYSASMSETVDPRTPVAIATSGLAGDPRRILERIAMAGVQAVQLSTDRPGIRPDDLDRSGRQDLRVAVRRRELRLAGLDHGFDPGELLSPDRVDSAAMQLLDAIRLAGDLGPVPIAVRFPSDGADEAIATADRVGAYTHRWSHIGSKAISTRRTGISGNRRLASWYAVAVSVAASTSFEQ